MRTLSLCLFILGLTACSGGGGGSSDGGATGGGGTTPVTNTAPALASANDDQSGQVGYDFSYDATQGGAAFSDADGDTLSYEVSFDPAPRGLSAADGVISGTPDEAGEITVTITASDPNGGSAIDSFVIDVTIDQSAIAVTFEGEIDLANLDDYENQAVPVYINEFNDGGNPVTDAGATLGRVLFYDPALSIDGTVSCASCHSQAHGFSDPDVVSSGVEGGVTFRHSMRLINTAFAEETRFFWDERAESHEDQETQPVADHNELGWSGQGGRGDLTDLFAKLEALEYYEELFRFVYGDAEITEARLQEMLAQFVKSIHSFDSRYDAGRVQVNNPGQPFPNFTAQENAGKQLFLDPPDEGGAGCQGCHREPEFDIRPGSGQNGVFGVANQPGEFDFTNTRSPSLRDLAAPDGTPNGPFMHDGSLTTLRAVIDHYDEIVPPTDPDALVEFRRTIDNRLNPGGLPQDLNLTEGEKEQLVAFLLTLSGEDVYTDEKYSDPFAD